MVTQEDEDSDKFKAPIHVLEGVIPHPGFPCRIVFSFITNKKPKDACGCVSVHPTSDHGTAYFSAICYLPKVCDFHMYKYING